MTVLEEIQAAAVDGKTDLGTILRKCKLLASRLGSQPLEDWLLWESNGYPDDVPVPDYRKWPLQLKGYFAGYFGARITNAPIPWLSLPEKVRDQYEHYECRQSIAGIEAILAGLESSTDRLHVSTGDLAVVLGDNVYGNYNCIQAWAEFGKGHLFELLNVVRNRILDFTLAIWKQDPTAGEIQATAKEKIEAAKVTQIFQTTIYGGTATFVGSAQNALLHVNVTTNNFDSLEAALKQQGVSKEDLHELQAAVTEDPRPTEKNKFGPRVSSWMGKMAKKAAEGVWNTTLDVGSKVLVEALTKYYFGS